ncbi:hypothetical protein IQ07DRAFT_680694 [Pyrenochaeta sp. DS3sAY3a]|nr:hypothetical protein IQ07DRAFT_680694 [Pyrenochaeta sp. DS3sAY3a]
MSAHAEEEARKRIIDALEGPTVKITVEYEDLETSWRVPGILLQQQTPWFHGMQDRNLEDPQDSDSDSHEDNDAKSFETSIDDTPPAAVKLFIYFMFFGCLPAYALEYMQIELCIHAYIFGEAYDAIEFKNCVMTHLYKTFSLSSATWKSFSLTEFHKYYRHTCRGSRVRRLLEIMSVEHFAMTEYMKKSRDRRDWVSMITNPSFMHQPNQHLLDGHRANHVGETSREVLALPLETFLDQGLPWEVED